MAAVTQRAVQFCRGGFTGFQVEHLYASLGAAGRQRRTTSLRSVRRFEEFLGHDLGEASHEAVRRWVDVLRQQAIGDRREIQRNTTWGGPCLTRGGAQNETV